MLALPFTFSAWRTQNIKYLTKILAYSINISNSNVSMIHKFIDNIFHSSGWKLRREWRKMSSILSSYCRNSEENNSTLLYFFCVTFFFLLFFTMTLTNEFETLHVCYWEGRSNKWIKSFDGGNKTSVTCNTEMQLEKNLMELYFESNNETVTKCIFKILDVWLLSLASKHN
jgi:hypothetical protein